MNLIAGWRPCHRKGAGPRNEGWTYHIDVRCRGTRIDIRQRRGAACCAPTERGAGSMNGNEAKKLPEGWTLAKLGNLVHVLRGVSYRKEDARDKPSDGFLPILRATNINGQLTFDDLVYVPERYVSDTQHLQVGDIVIAASSGSRDVVGKAAPLITPWVGSFGAFCYGLRPIYYGTARFIAWFLQTSEYRDRVSALSAGVNINNLRREHIEETPIPFAPLSEQHRIVAEIEKQFTRLDAGIAALERARANLKRYRASVLKAACEGRLVPTEAELARKEGREYEPAEQLLARILKERRAKWEADQLAKMKEQGKAPKDDKWKKKYQEPTASDTTDLAELPEGWVIASMDQLSVHITSGSRDWSKYYGRGQGIFLMAQNIRPGKLDLSYRQQVDPPKDDRDRIRSQVRRDDLLVTIVGANTGDVCRVPKELPEHFVCQSVALMRPVDPMLSPFLEIYMTSEENGQRQYRRYIYGAGRPHLSFDQLKMTSTLLPPLTEQQRIVAEVERRLSVVDELEAVVAANLKRAERLRQSILKRAFEGKLVPQDPNDEPASVLLQRIRMKRQTVASDQGRSTQKTNSQSLKNYDSLFPS